MTLLFMLRPLGATPPHPGGQEYQTGSHDAFVKGSKEAGYAAVFTMGAALLGIATIQPKPAFASTLPQTYDVQQSFVQPYHFEPTAAVVSQVIPATWTLPQEASNTQSSVQQVWINQLISVIPTGQEYHHGTHRESIEDSASRGSSVFPAWRYTTPAAQQPIFPATWTAPQSYDVLQGAVQKVWIRQLLDVPNRPTLRGDYQSYDVQQGSVYHTLIQQFIAPPNRPLTWTRDYWDTRESTDRSSRVFPAWRYTLPQAPPLRGAITTVAETPQDVPSSVRGDVAQFAQFALVVVPPVPPEYQYGTHNLEVLTSHLRSSMWSAVPPSVTIVNYPPVNPRYEYGTHEQHLHQDSIRSTVASPWQIRLFEPYFISHDVIGEIDENPNNGISVVFKPQPAPGPAISPPPLGPWTTTQTYPQPYDNDRTSTWKHPLSAPVETLTIHSFSRYTLPQEFQARDDSRIYHQPPRTVTSPRNYRAIQTLPQPYEHLQGKVFAVNIAARLQRPVMRRAVQTFPQPELDNRPSSVFHKAPQPVTATPLRPHIRTLPQPFDVQQGEVYSVNIPLTLQRPRMKPAIQTLPQPDLGHRPSWVAHQPPRTAMETPKKAFIVTRPQNEGVQYPPSVIYHQPPRTVTSPPQRPYVLTYPQEYPEPKPSEVRHQPPETVYSPEYLELISTTPQYPGWRDVNYSLVVPLNAAMMPSATPVLTTVNLVGIELTIAQGTLTPKVVKNVGRIITEPKYIGATAELTPPFNFSSNMEAGETLLTARVVSTVYTGVDPSPAAILSGPPVINGAIVEQMMKGGTIGCVYDLVCTVTTSLGQTLEQSTYFYVEPYLP